MSRHIPPGFLDTGFSDIVIPGIGVGDEYTIFQTSCCHGVCSTSHEIERGMWDRTGRSGFLSSFLHRFFRATSVLIASMG